MGQPTKANTKLAHQIALLVSRGVKLADAAEQSGVDHASLNNWMKWGREGREPWASFQEIVTDAVSKGRKPKQAG